MQGDTGCKFCAESIQQGKDQCWFCSAKPPVSDYVPGPQENIPKNVPSPALPTATNGKPITTAQTFACAVGCIAVLWGIWSLANPSRPSSSDVPVPTPVTSAFLPNAVTNSDLATPDPSLKTGAKMRTIGWMEAWKRRDYAYMARMSQPSQHETASTLESFLGSKKLLSYNIVKSHLVSDVMCKVEMRITYKEDRRKPETHTITANLIRENNEGESSSSGIWGINPTSTGWEDRPS